jgi:carbon monoxide dehydrogenase subunit G
MAHIEIAIVIAAPPAVVWRDVRDISTHVTWMADAESIEFSSPSREGVGTTFDCATKFGPVRLVDRMEVTEWEPERAMGVRHVGVVTGSGRFILEPVGRGHTRFSWREELTFPPLLGGSLGAQVARPIMRAVWRRNLRSLKARVEALPRA